MPPGARPNPNKNTSDAASRRYSNISGVKVKVGNTWKAVTYTQDKKTGITKIQDPSRGKSDYYASDKKTEKKYGVGSKSTSAERRGKLGSKFGK